MTGRLVPALLAVTMATVAGLGIVSHAPARAAGKSAVGAWGVDLTGIDTSVNPGDDFFRYAVGKWIDRTPIPPDQAEWYTLVELGVKAEADVRVAIEKAAAAGPAQGTIEQKVSDAYAAYLDTATINALGTKPFDADLAYIRSIRTHDDAAALMGRPGFPGNAPFAFFPTVDGKNPDRYALFLTQAGLGLPIRDFYLSDNPAFAAIRAKYRDYVAKMLGLVNYPDADAAASAVFALETAIATRHWPLEKARNKDLVYNARTLAELQAEAPGVPWPVLLESMGLKGRDRFIVKELDAVVSLATLFRETPVDTWRAYFTFHYLNAEADIMPDAFETASFEFAGKVLSGLPERPARWKRAVGEVSGPYGAGPLGEAVGRIYVKEHFTPEAKANIRRIIDNLLAAYQKRISALAWMSPETRQAAIRKAQTVRVKIGFPDRWKDYTALTIVPGDAYGNRKRISLFENDRLLGRLDSPTDKEEWSQGPQIVNAYYKAEFNEIGFPAAILQPPFFDPNADPAVNYGSVGGVVGHEMGHGYDDQGAKSDEHGVLRTWWKPEDEQRFQLLTKALAAQYSTYSPIEGQHVNGNATSGENIGDLGGLSVALEAYRTSLGGKPAPVLDGFTGEQRFFLGWAQVWRGKYRDERLREIVARDVHSPIMYRVNGVVRNIDAWYDAFAVKPGTKLHIEPKDRVRIW